MWNLDAWSWAASWVSENRREGPRCEGTGVGGGGLSESRVSSLRASLIFVRRQRRENRGGLSLNSLPFTTSVVGGARVRKGKLQLGGWG